MIKKLVVISILCCAFIQDCFSQKISKLEDLGNTVEIQWQVNFQVRTYSTDNYAVLKDGIAVYDPGKNSIIYKDFTAQLKWEKPALGKRNGLFASPNGEYLYAFTPLDEYGGGISAVWSSDGELLWQKNDSYYYNISPSGKFLISHYSSLRPRPLNVLDIETGKALWEFEPASYWQAAVSENDWIIYYTYKSLQLYDLRVGNVIWEKSIDTEIQEHHDSSKLHISENGKTVVLQAMFAANRNIETYVFDSEGHILWKVSKQLVPGETNGGMVQAVSDDGKYIAMSDLQRFLLFSRNKPDPLWVLNERMTPQYIQTFTNGVLAFRSHPNNTTRVMVLNNDGVIKQDYLFHERIEFRTPWPKRVLIIEPNPERLAFSLFELDLFESN